MNLPSIAGTVLLVSAAAFLAACVIYSHKRDKARRDYWRDKRTVTPGNTCAACGGYATQLENGFCKDAALCEAARAFQRMLQSPA